MNFTGNTVEHGGAPIDKETIFVCPVCHSTDVFEVSKTGMCVCRNCWNKDTPFAFLPDAEDYIDYDTAKGY